jgi:hypothetical protein
MLNLKIESFVTAVWTWSTEGLNYALVSIYEMGTDDKHKPTNKGNRFVAEYSSFDTSNQSRIDLQSSLKPISE